MKIPNSIRIYRRKANLNQSQLAEILGMNRTQLYFLESGQILPTFEQAENIAKALNTIITSLYPEFVLAFIVENNLVKAGL